MTKVIYYQNETDDVVTSAHQNYVLKADYQWVKSSKVYQTLTGFLARLLYCGAIFYQKYQKIDIVGQERLQLADHSGYLVYGNHTQPFGDVLTPFAISGKHKRVYPIAHPSNLGIPVIGWLLPLFGALPTPQNKQQYGKFLKAIKQHLAEKSVVMVYPEAHVWPYYTKIRPFPATSFRFTVDNQVPIFTATSTYVDNGRAKPKQVIFIDGPFYPDKTLSKKAAQEALCQQAFDIMTQRSTLSTVNYIHYEKISAKEAQ